MALYAKLQYSNPLNKNQSTVYWTWYIQLKHTHRLNNFTMKQRYIIAYSIDKVFSTTIMKEIFCAEKKTNSAHLTLSRLKPFLYTILDSISKLCFIKHPPENTTLHWWYPDHIKLKSTSFLDELYG